MEHHDNALQQAAVAARAMLGEAVSYVSPFWFWTDQLGVNLQVVGRTDVYDDRVFRGDLDHMDCTILYLQDGVVTGAVTIERPTEMRAAIRMVRKQIRVEQQRLAGDDLRRILREPAE
jgi:3-phenylpropionate/trans-cinnamate dioxygenase ferredoxin reductase subunit